MTQSAADHRTYLIFLDTKCDGSERYLCISSYSGFRNDRGVRRTDHRSARECPQVQEIEHAITREWI